MATTQLDRDTRDQGVGCCASDDSIGITSGVNLWSDPFHDDDWIYYYDEGDEYFLTGLTDEEKGASPE